MTKIDMALQSANETRALEIGMGILNLVPVIFKEQFGDKKAIVIADTKTFEIAGKEVSGLLQQSGIEQDQPFIFQDKDLYAEMKFETQLENALKKTTAIPVAVGSGTINDLTKLASHRTGRPYMCVATAASMDGYTAFGASVTYKGAKQTFDCPAPQAVIADIEIIKDAPKDMTASGYADLFAKVTAGADWILADELGEELIDPTAWSIVQDGLRAALANPESAGNGSADAIAPLVEGLMLGGFAMQWSKTSRPASGAEHQFSHLWDMEHHTQNGRAPSHGFKVGVATLAVSHFYEQMLQTAVDKLNVETCCAQWPSLEEQEEEAREMFSDTNFLETALAETRAKYISKDALAKQLTTLKENWPQIKDRLQEQLLPAAEVKKRLGLVGAPNDPRDIGITLERLRESFFRAQHIRRRFTVLDVAVRTGYMNRWLNQMFDNKFWN